MRRVVASGLLVGLLALTACGADDPKLERAEPRQWAKKVCGAIGPMSKELTELQQSVSTTIDQAADVDTKKRELVTLFTEGEKLTNEALREVERAGVPDVDNGRVIADSFVKALISTRDSFEQGRLAIEKLPTDDSTQFDSGVVTAFEDMSEKNNESTSAFAEVKAPELDQAFSELPECNSPR
ncbi:MAG: hypothetical protein HOQ05_08510 [Corynebacteriales bacterium]|nr:hypothetical protein [Mycobacteriales bacterium]